MFRGALESIIQLSEWPSELNAICAMRAMLFLSDNLIGKVENRGTEPILQTQHMHFVLICKPLHMYTSKQCNCKNCNNLDTKTKWQT